MVIWGAPTYYSSSYSDNQFYKYRNDRDEALANANRSIVLCKELAAALKDSIDNRDTNEIIGWEVLHTFRCKTYGGYSDLTRYRYVISKDFKHVLIREDDDEGKEQIQLAVETVMGGYMDEINLIEL